MDGEYYPFDKENGAIAEGLTELPNGITRYYYGDGAYHTGWFYQNGKTYYFNDVDGAMFTGWQTIDDQTLLLPRRRCRQGRVAGAFRETLLFR